MYIIVEIQGQLRVVESNQKLILQNQEQAKKMNYAFLLAMSGLGIFYVMKGRFVSGSILYKFQMISFRDVYDKEVLLALLNDHFKHGQLIYFDDFEARVELIDGTLLGRQI